ncbi:SMP-30/gluconolactonase/LRE family protein [Psychromarinibacter sp. C21-152]|uniref:SMP-30/gluconolactonase/LRE family protein n=1 Tax=Psychromarinibacter sediminicola TaxID=3033385 RepID=A0AAE3NYM6_9RHOB|nr:SMP-30/gluconolactonase/LRE family protein [Psychromarinibacter sediminicola]MDF0603107.1 SMP-30/gluconolactonase/LRE family protein [Psychromarinibacter sediminicola]
MSAEVFDNRRCELGEGPLWHPERQQLFWFDILSAQLMTQTDGAPRRWQFDELVSAAGWVDRSTLLIASETRLIRFDLDLGDETTVCHVECDDPARRSNDARADRQGGFWIGTMGKSAEDGAGIIYRYYKGELRQLVEGISIPNAICFSPDGTLAYYACSRAATVWRQPLDGEGWPKGDAEVFLDLSGDGHAPDGAVTDAEGNFWNAQWGSFRVAVYSPEGKFLRAHDVPAKHCSCPAFGGAELRTLYVTSALESLDPEEAARSENGMTYSIDAGAQGVAEPKVIL